MRLVLVLSLLVFYSISSAQTIEEYITLAKEHRNDKHYEEYMLLADSLASTAKLVKSSGKINQELGQYYYTRNADKAIEHFKKAYTLLTEIKDVNNAIFCLQNIAFSYEEKKHDLVNAQFYAERAIEERKGIKDTLQLANMYKYLGYLQGKAGKYAEAKESIHTGIDLFNSKKYVQGMAVCYFDMGKVYGYQQQYDSAVYYFRLSIGIWKDLGNQQARLFNVNNSLLHLYNINARMAEAVQVFADNKAILKKEFIYWSDKLDFYKYSAEYFTAKQDRLLSDVFKSEYNKTKDSLVKAGIQVIE